MTVAAAPPGDSTSTERSDGAATALASAYPPAPPVRVPGPEACPLCGAPLNPDQDWCLRCGAAARTRLAATPNWKTPIVTIAVVAVLALGVLAAALVKLAGDSGSSTTTTTTTVAAPAASTAAVPTTTAAAVPGVSTPTTPAASVPGTTTPSGGVIVPTTTAGGVAPSGAATTTTPGDTSTGTSTSELSAKNRATIERLLKPGAKKTAAP